MAVVVDASVALKWLVEEADSAAALLLRAEHDVLAPDLLLIECRNALLSHVRQKKMSRDAALRAEIDLNGSGIEIVASRPLLPGAFVLALDLGEPIYDCIYLAAAIATDRPLVTADARFAKTANRLAVAKGRVTLLGA